MLSSNYEVVIVGAGAAGLSAALTLTRARRRVLVIDSGSYRNRMATHAHGFLTRDGVSPREFLEIGRQEILRYGGEIVSGTVSSLEVQGDTEVSPNLIVKCDDQLIPARALLVATGLTDELPNIPGVSALWGNVVLHCSYCHGAELNPSDDVIVIGGSNVPFILKQARLLCQWVSKVTLVTCGMKLDADTRLDLSNRGIDIIDDYVEKVDTTPLGKCLVKNRSGRILTVAAAFVGPIFKPNDSLLRVAGCDVDSSDWIKVDRHGKTTVAQIWAAGNVVSSPAQMINAAAEGATAAININDTLIGA